LKLILPSKTPASSHERNVAGAKNGVVGLTIGFIRKIDDGLRDRQPDRASFLKEK
jgi:hypothetical protein